jgi:tetratricopeptide (TPR) repeat protein
MVRFEEVNYFIGIILVVIFLIIVNRVIQKQSHLSKTWEGNLFLSKLAQGMQNSKWPLRISLYGLGLFAGIIGLTNPQYGYHNEQVVKSSNDIFVGLDISNSMKAIDIAPDRLTKAKQYAADLITKLKGNNIGLIFFAGEAYMQMPLTSDYAAAVMMVNTADCEMAGLQGTDIGSVADLVTRANNKQAKPSNYLVLVTDGEDHDERGVAGISKLTEAGMKTFIVAAGTEKGGMISQNNDYKRDPITGEPIITKINLDYINQLAKAGQGRAFSLEDESSISTIVNAISSSAKSSSTMKSINEYNSYFQLFALLALLAFLIEYFISKKSYLIPLSKKNLSLILVLLLATQLGIGQNKKDLSDGVNSYKRQKYQEAESKFKKAKETDKSGKAAYNLGNTLYKQGKYDDAVKSYEETAQIAPSQKLKSQAQFNKGNAKVQQQKFDEAIQDYKSSLKANGSDLAALNNLMKAKRDMKKQQEQQKNKDQQNQDQQNQDQQNKNQPPQDQNKDQNKDKEDQKDKDQNKDNKDQNKDQQPQQNQSTPKDLSKNQALQMIEREDEKVQKKLKRNPSKSGTPLKDW